MRILRALSERQIARLDALILTHADSDHIGGAPEIINRIPIDNVYSNAAGSTAAFLDLIVALEARNIKMTSLTAGQVVRLDETANFYVISPDSLLLASANAENQRSLVMRFECNGSSVLFTGDVDSLIEDRLAAWDSLLNVDILKVSHHGSKTATTERFLAATTPDYAVISASRSAVRNHPDPSVLSRLNQYKIIPLTTNSLGNLEFVSKSGGWQLVEQPNQALIRRWHLNATG